MEKIFKLEMGSVMSVTMYPVFTNFFVNMDKKVRRAKGNCGSALWG